jgi:hypothetical protein
MTTHLHDREPQLLARDTAYAVAALTDEALAGVRSLSGRVVDLRAEAPAKLEEFRTRAPETVKGLPKDAETRLEEGRARLQADLEGRVAGFETRFDAKASAGADVVARLSKDERVVRVETALTPVGEQAKIARSQVKGAITSLRGTIDAALSAGREQADNAAAQVKGAVTSSRRTVDAAVTAGRNLAS